MFGDNILVAPLFGNETKRKVVLPPGKWYDFYTGKLAGDGEVITVKCGLDKIPLFVKDGGIIPMIPRIRQTKEWKDLPLEVRVYGKADGEFIIYDDDGTSYDFENGAYTMKKLIVKNGKGSVEDIRNDGPWSYSGIKWKFMGE
jgi:alpha-D-xyloside xylohydrolase